MRTAPTDEATKDDLHGRIARIRRSIPRMARATIDRYIAASPLYTQTAVPEHLHRESAHTVRSMLEVCLRSVTDESIDVSDTMRENIERGTERVAEGLPLREYMRCWQAGFDVLAEELERELGTDHGLFWFAFRRAHTTFDRILREVVSAYEIHTHDLIAAQDRNHAPIIDALLRGDEWVFDDPDSIPAEPSIMLLHIDDTPRRAIRRPQRPIARGHTEGPCDPRPPGPSGPRPVADRCPTSARSDRDASIDRRSRPAGRGPRKGQWRIGDDRDRERHLDH